MTLIFHCNDGKTITSNDPINSYSEYYCYSDKIVSSGSWYGELSHESGSNMHYIGIENKCGSINFNPVKNLQKPSIVSFGCFNLNNKINQEERPFPISIEDKHVIGISCNINMHSFNVFYNSSFYTFSYSSNADQSNEYRFRFGGGTFPDTFDQYTVNFGSRNFTYSVNAIPFGFNKKHSTFNNYNNKNYLLISTFCVILL